MARRDSTEVETISASEVNESEIGIIDPKTFVLPAVENPYEKDIDIFSSGLFLPRLQLEGSNSKLVKTRKVPLGNYVVISGRDVFEILGEKVEVLVLCYRSKALDVTDNKNIVAVFDKDDPEFKRIVGSSGMGYLYGLEFLVWIPSCKGTTKFATFFMGNPTMRNAAKNMKPLLRTAKNPTANNQALLGCETINNGEYIWEGPTILPCTSPLSCYPGQDEATIQMKMFLDPPKSVVREQVPEEEATAAGTERER